MGTDLLFSTPLLFPIQAGSSACHLPSRWFLAIVIFDPEDKDGTLQASIVSLYSINSACFPGEHSTNSACEIHVSM
jgi:hypothetical protein